MDQPSAAASPAGSGEADSGGSDPRVARLGSLLPSGQLDREVRAGGLLRAREAGAVSEQEGWAVRATLGNPQYGVLAEDRGVSSGWNRHVVQGSADSGAMKDLGKPDAREPHVRFDEGRLEMGFVLGQQRLQGISWTAPDQSTAAPVSYSNPKFVQCVPSSAG